MTDILTAILWLAGSAFALLAAIGVLRMPDVFTRMQASTKASTLGLGCLLVGAALQIGGLRVVHPRGEHRRVRAADDAGGGRTSSPGRRTSQTCRCGRAPCSTSAGVTRRPRIPQPSTTPTLNEP